MSAIGSERLLEIFIALLQGKHLKKSELMEQYGISGPTVQRDIKAIRQTLSNYLPSNLKMSGMGEEKVILNISKGIYSLNKAILAKTNLIGLSNLEDYQLLAVLKIIISSRAFTNQELESLMALLVDKDFPFYELLLNEKVYYQGVPDEPIWEKLALIARATKEQRMIAFDYTKNFVTEHFEKTVEMIFFNDLYFYIATHNHQSQDDTIQKNLNKFRINNMKNLKLLEKGKKLPYNQRFEMAELANRSGAFAYFGAPIEVIIDFYYDPTYVFDRFPRHRILSECKENQQIVTRIAFETNDGYGLKMWLLMQGKQLKIIRPISLKNWLLKELEQISKLYE